MCSVWNAVFLLLLGFYGLNAQLQNFNTASNTCASRSSTLVEVMTKVDFDNLPQVNTTTRFWLNARRSAMFYDINTCRTCRNTDNMCSICYEALSTITWQESSIKITETELFVNAAGNDTKMFLDMFFEANEPSFVDGSNRTEECIELGPNGFSDIRCDRTSNVRCAIEFTLPPTEAPTEIATEAPTTATPVDPTVPTTQPPPTAQPTTPRGEDFKVSGTMKILGGKTTGDIIFINGAQVEIDQLSQLITDFCVFVEGNITMTSTDTSQTINLLEYASSCTTPDYSQIQLTNDGCLIEGTSEAGAKTLRVVFGDECDGPKGFPLWALITVLAFTVLVIGIVVFGITHDHCCV